MNHRNWIVAFTAIVLVALFAMSAMAVPEKTPVFTDVQLRAIAQRVMNGQPISPIEKAAASNVINEMARARAYTPPATDLVGGPDGFGYRFLDNVEPGGPAFNWIAPGAANVAGLSDDNYAGPFPIGFTFSFYGTAYTEFYAGSNGRIQFGTPYPYNYGSWSPDTYPGVYFWNQDMYVRAETQVNYQNLTGPNRLVVTYTNLSYYSYGTSHISCQVILYESGEVTIQYGARDGSVVYPGGSGLYGGSLANSLSYMATAPGDGSAVKFYTLGQAANPIPANGATNVPTNAVLSWSAASGASGYDVFYGTDNPPMTMVSSNQAGLNYTPAVILPSTVYYWQIVSRSAASTNAGPVWSFTTGAGAAPNAPSNGLFNSATITDLSGTWDDNSTDETGFPYYHSFDGVNYTLGGTWGAIAGTGTRPWGISGLNGSTHAWMRVFATGAGGTSTGYAEANGWTLANVPTAPTVGAATYTTIDVTTNNSVAPINEAGAQYAIYETTTGMYVQGDGSLGLAANWAGLGTTTVNGLTTGATYTFQAKARNGAGVETAFGPTASGTTASLGSGGPDAFGYRYHDNTAGGPAFNWITPGGTNITGLGDDNFAGPFPIGFTFNFYGTPYTDFYAGSNGRITFGAGNGSYYWQALPLPTSAPGVYFWNNDLHCGYGTTTVNYQLLTAPNRLVVTYLGLAIYGSGGASRFDAQAILYETGEVVCQFTNYVGTLSRAGGGIQNTDGTTYLGYYNLSDPLPAANTAVQFYSLGQASNPIPADLATNVPTNSQLSWTAASGATGYDVYFGTDNPPATLVSANQAGTNYTPTLATLTTYYWKIVALMGATTNAGPVWSFTTGAGAAPNAPTDAQFISATTNSITGSFMDNSTDETGFPFYGSTDGTNFTYAFTAPAVPGTGVRNQTIITLIPATHYWTRIYAQGAGGTSVNFAETNAWTLAAVPDAPTLGAPTFSTIPVTVNNNTANANSALATYAIRVNGTSWVQANGTLGGAAVWQTLATWGTVVVNGLTGSTLYTFDVAARNGSDVESAYSGTAAASTTAWSPNPNIYAPAVGVLPAAISDNATGDIPIIVTGVGAVTDVDIKISGTHTYTGDVDFELVHPNGTVVGLFFNRGGGGDNWTNMILDDEAAASISTGTPPFTGTWIPEQPLSGLDFLEGSGTWYLRWRDEAGGDVGFVTAVELALGLNAAAPPGVPFGPTPSNGAVNIGPNPVLGWSGANATSYDVYLGTTNPPTTAVSMGQAGSTFAAGPLTQSSTYYWYINAHNANGATPGPVWSFTTATPPTGLIGNNVDANVTLNWNPSSGGESAYMEDFNDGIAQGWTFLPDATGFTYPAGNLQYACTGLNNWRQLYYSATYTDVSVETDITRTTTNAGNSIGIFVRMSGDMNSNANGYLFNITHNGYSSVFVIQNGGILSNPQPWTTNPAINTTLGTYNVARVNAVGSNFSLYCNNVLLFSFTDATYASGLVGVGTYDGLTASEVLWNYVSIRTSGIVLAPPMGSGYPVWDSEGKVSQDVITNCSLPAVNNPYTEPRGIFPFVNAADVFINYRVYRNSVLLATTTDTSYADVLPDYGTYTYAVSAVYTEGESNPTNNAVITYLPPTPGDPSALTITYTGGNAVLSWTGSTGTVTGYHIYRFSTGYFAPPTSGTLIGSTDNATFTYTDTGVNGQYYYRVTAYNGIATSSIPTGGSERVIRTLTPTTK